MELDQPVAQAVLLDGVGSETFDALVVRRRRSSSGWESCVAADRRGPRTGARLRLPARARPTLGRRPGRAEIGDFARFERPRRLMELSRARAVRELDRGKRRQGAITKSGTDHARRLLVEAAWHYRRTAEVGRELDVAKRASRRRSSATRLEGAEPPAPQMERLDQERGKRRTIVAVAVARELAGFCWAAATSD